MDWPERTGGSRTRRRSTRLAALALALPLSVVAAACGSDGGDDIAAPAGESGGPVLDASVLSGAATTLDGGSFELGTLADKDLVVWFWAPW